MQNKKAVSLCVVLAALCAPADYVKLGSARFSSLNDVGSAASALGILAEQPMIGMMAMGGLQQVVTQTFGMADQSKPMGAVVYYKTALPDFKGMEAEAFAESMAGMATNLAFAIYVPVSGPEEDYLKSRGATNAVDGAYTADDTLFAVVQGGYAVWGDSPATVKLAAGEMAGTLKSKLDGMAVEIDYGKAVLQKYGEFMTGMNQMQKQMAAEMAAMTDQPVETNAWKTALESYQQASMEASAKMLEQIDSMVVGLGADITRGISVGVSCGFAPGSDLGGIMAKAVPVDPKLYDAVPASADLFVAIGNCGQMSYDTETSMDLVAKTLLPQIKDEAIRKQAESLLSGLVSLTKQAGASVMFVDRDKQGRMVVASKTASADPAKYLAANGRLYADFFSMVGTLVPEQKFASFDAAAGKMGFDFVSLFKLLDAKFGEEGDETGPEEMETVFKVLDALMGRSVEGAYKLEGDRLAAVCRAVGSDYEAPVAGDGAALAARIAAVMPAGSTAKPFETFSLSLSSMIRHYGARIASAIGEDGEDVAKIFAALPDAAPGGLTMAAWAEGPAVKASMNLSAAEFKWFVKMFTDFAAQDAAAQAAFEAEALSEKAGVEDDDAEDIVVIDEEDEEDDEVDAPAAPAAPAAE